MPFEYAIIRVVPHEARGEFVNAGIVLYVPATRFLRAEIAFDPKRLAAIAPQANPSDIESYLAAIIKICAGGIQAGALGELSPAERFRWLTSPRNTIIQTSPVHSGLTDDPAESLTHLVKTLVAMPISP
jgi:hypothetical protein